MTAIALQPYAETTAATVDAGEVDPGDYVLASVCQDIEQRFNALREAATLVTAARGVESKREAILNLADWLLNTASA